MSRYRRHPALLDRLAIAAATICIVNCLGLTLALSIWPWLWLSRKAFGVDLGWLLQLELALAGTSLALALLAIGWGWHRHRRIAPTLFALPGLALLAFGMFSPLHRVSGWGTAVVLAGAALLIAAHLRNLALMRRPAG